MRRVEKERRDLEERQGGEGEKEGGVGGSGGEREERGRGGEIISLWEEGEV